MRKICLIVIMFVLFTVTVPSTTVAQDSPLGLQWGTSVGEHFVYDYRLVAHVNLASRVDIEVTALREIPTTPDILDFETILSSGVASYTNGSPLDWFDQPPFKVLPVGNWSYVTLVYEEYYGSNPNFEITNTSTSWGFSHGDSEYQKRVIYDKSTGVIRSYLSEHRDENGALLSLWKLTQPNDTLIILTFGGGTVLVILLAWFYRGKKLKSN